MTTEMVLSVRQETWPMRQVLRIAGATFDRFESVVVEIASGNFVGRGEGLPVFYLGETANGMLQQVESIRADIEAGIARRDLARLLPPGGARNAIDCALWELEAKQSGQTVWDLAGITPKPLPIQLSLSIAASPEDMGAQAAEAPFNRLKIKLDADRPIEKLKAIREARPDAHLVIDANQGWTGTLLETFLPDLVDIGVMMIEQPLPRGDDDALRSIRSPIPICADESCLHIDELDDASTKYGMINIKLDKTGGLTSALDLAAAARERGLSIMVGCMGGGSLAIAPACLVAAIADVADLDGTLWQKSDRLPGLQIADGIIAPFGPQVWG